MKRREEDRNGEVSMKKLLNVLNAIRRGC